MQNSRFIHLLIDPATRHWAVGVGILVAVVGIVPLVRNAVLGNHGRYYSRFGPGGSLPPWLALVTYSVMAVGFIYFCYAAYQVVHALR
jgi:hypothetical protein